MLRKLCSVAAALICIAGLGLAASAPAQARSVLPHHGTYTGVDHGQRIVSLSFNGTTVTHFTVGHLVIGSAHVSNGMFHETCHNGYCFKGMWMTDTRVEGYWRHGGSHTWTPWSATVNQAVVPYAGPYLGRDHRTLRVHFSYHSGYVRSFSLDHNLLGDAPVSNGGFDVCFTSICVKGHWQDPYNVVGSWRYRNSSEWNPWEVNAYAA